MHLTAKRFSNTEDLVTWIHRSLEALWLLAVILVPLAFVTKDNLISSSAIAYLEVPKIAILRTLAGLMAVLWLLELGFQSRFSIGLPGPLLNPRSLRPRPGAWLAAWFGWLSRRPIRWLLLAVVLYLATTLLSTLLSASFSVSLWGTVPGEDGYAAYTIAAYLVLFGVVATHLRTTDQLWRLLAAIVAMGVLVAGYGIAQHYGYDPFNLRFPVSTFRVTSTMGNAILAAAVLLLTIPVTLVAAAVTLRGSMRAPGFWWKVVLWALALSVQLLALKFTDSRGPWAGTLVAVVALLGLTLVVVGWRWLARIGLVLVISLIIAGVVLLLPSRLQGTGGPAEASVSTSQLGNDTGVTEVTASVSSRVAGRGLSGRIEIWEDSWQLMLHRPWFAFDDLSLSPLRGLVGYGPDLFSYNYLLESSPQEPNLIPAGAAHAHNYFIHQGVELGYLGLLSSLGILVALFTVGGYLLLRQRRDFSDVHKLLLVGVLATLAGRTLEQLVGLARVSDLTIFWVLLALFVALPVVMKSGKEAPELVSAATNLRSGGGRPTALSSSVVAPIRVLVLTIVAGLVIGIGMLTWFKTINYPRAAVLAAEGVSRSRDGNLQGALSSLNKTISLAPDVSINYDRRAAVYNAYRNKDLAVKEPGCAHSENSAVYDACLAQRVYLDHLAGAEQRPLDFRSRQSLANSTFELAVLRGDQALLDSSLRFYQEVIDLVPAAYPLYDQLGAAYLRSGQPEAALKPLRDSLAITGEHRSSERARQLLGVAYRDLGDPSMAIKEFDGILRIRPESPEAFNHRAMIYWNLGEYDRALDDLDNAIKYEPKYAEAYSNRGFSYRELGQPQRAVEDLDEAIRLDPRYAVAYNNRGLAHSDLGQLQRAVDDYSQAIRLDPGYVQAYLNRGAAWSDQGQPNNALTDSEAALELDESNPRTYALRAMAYTQLGRDTEARRDAERAVQLGIQREFLETKLRQLRDER